MIISLDTETTGIDAFHGALPFFVTICTEEGEIIYWQWKVDPLTRKVLIPEEDKLEIKIAIDNADRIIMQNGKFDVTMLEQAGIIEVDSWDWDKTEDTLRAGHILASNKPHNLTDMAMQYLGEDIAYLEKHLKDIVQKCRRWARTNRKDWRIAKEGLEEMPSAKQTTWRFDYWLPRAVAREIDSEEGEAAPQEYYTVLKDYANMDSPITLKLWLVMEGELRRIGLWDIYREMMKLYPLCNRMQRNAVTYSGERLDKIKAEYKCSSTEAKAICINIAKSYGYDLELPKSSNSVNDSLRDFCFGSEYLNLPHRRNKKDKTNAPSMDKATLESYLLELPEASKQLTFIKSLMTSRKRDTAISFMEGYTRFRKPYNSTNGDDVSPDVVISEEEEITVVECDDVSSQETNWWKLHPGNNPTGTDTLRWSFNNPNEANISKQKGFNLRYCFGPAPGREWWSMDYQNIELRIPAFEAEETLLMDVYNRPNDPPYYGSYHLVVFDILHPDLFKKYGKEVKDDNLFGATWYQWVKNGNFAVIYGAQEETADRTYRVAGAYQKIRSRFPKIAKLNDKMIAYANKHGYVETIPDKTVCKDRGYPLLCSRSEWGNIIPTTPLNYHVSGSAMWCTNKAMIRCEEQLQEWKRRTGFTGFLCMQVHDELVFDFPKIGNPATWKRNDKSEENKSLFHNTNLWRIWKLKGLMEKSGEDIGVPSPVAVELHNDNWSKSVVL